MMEETPTFEDLENYYKAKVTPHLNPSMEKMIYFLSCISDFINSPPGALKRYIENLANSELQKNWLIESLNAFEDTLANPPKEKGILAIVVSRDANQGLDDPTSDDEAIVILKHITQMMRDALGDNAPPKP
ncbi:MAG: hypothetical protein H7Z37_10715 [Pyrinomonadaceae bacterium]|nr:hypothetical protein [Pyrinomonadaceae bacterium]